jgi:hypothetical protein
MFRVKKMSRLYDTKNKFTVLNMYIFYLKRRYRSVHSSSQETHYSLHELIKFHCLMHATN